MSTILARYSEIGLKSDPVRRRFESMLQRNMVSMLVEDSVEALVTRGNARFYIETEDTDAAIASLRKVFGIASLSVATVVPSDMDSMVAATVELSKSIIRDGESFAIRARRNGENRGFTSMDIERTVGAAVMDANAGRGISVNLTDPDRIVYIEARCGKAYIFPSYIRCHAGLPLGSQGAVVAEVDDDRGLASAWLMMKRGCRVTVRGSHRTDLLMKYDPRLRTLGRDDPDPYKSLGTVLGTTVDTFGDICRYDHGLPLFFPTIGMGDDEVEAIVATMERE